MPGPHPAYRLSNTSRRVGEVLRDQRVILLENALIDTRRPLDFPIPASLRAGREPGAYIVQARVASDARFRGVLEHGGAKVVAYIPNNAFLVRASAAEMERIGLLPEVQAVLPYEPYYKLKTSLLEFVLREEMKTQGRGGPSGLLDLGSMPVADGSTQLSEAAEGTGLNVLLFPDSMETTIAALARVGAEVLGQEDSPFGNVLKVRCPAARIARVAALPGVQEIEIARRRAFANDISRVALGIASNAGTSSNYLGLSGTNVLVSVNDTGVDASHPDLAGRVILDASASGLDPNGHGTHIAGVIAGSGAASLSVDSAQGSILPASDLQFRGIAPAARIFAVQFDPEAEPAGTDGYLALAAAGTNAVISNNSWYYSGDNEYDLAAARYDAVVRDALPGVTGPQPLVCVFAAGNAGGGSDDGTGGKSDTIQSPGTAKNVITVGALEHPRGITNQTWTCSGTGSCVTNQPWLGMTDSAGQVAAFSSRGNVGIGIEGDFGRFKPDVVAPGTFVLSARSAQWDQAAYYADSNRLVTAWADTNSVEVLSNLNRFAGPFYRFESGTSTSAAEVSGTLALMQEYLRDRLRLIPSPALMKALLINGARAIGTYDFHVQSGTNFQGWGLINLPNSLPPSLTSPGPGAGSMFFHDQTPSDALATGEKKTWFVSISPGARTQPLRVTLVWTDPPGNPVAGLKLVNDLDLVVTNLDSGEVFFGNDIPAGSTFNSPSSSLAAPNADVINNVENLFLAPGLNVNYSVTVLARRVSVNAVSARPDNVVQDYALVISSGEGRVSNALSVVDSPPVSTDGHSVTAITNQFGASSAAFGGILWRQRVGANAALPSSGSIALDGGNGAVLAPGDASQWRFYVLTNDTAFTNAAFVTFQPPSAALSPQQASVSGLSSTNSFEADIDLYISLDPSLTNLDAGALALADRSVNRGGEEMIVYSNATPGVFYVGVKCESQRAAEYAFMAILSESPFADLDFQGNQFLRTFPGTFDIPGGGSYAAVAIAPNPILVHRVIVTNTLSILSACDVRQTLTHEGVPAVLLNHPPALPDRTFVIEDSGEGDIPNARPSDGPGSLADFAGGQGAGVWISSVTTTNHSGTVEDISIYLEAQQPTAGGFTTTILAGGCREDFVPVGSTVTNLTTSIDLDSGTGPVSVQMSPVGLASSNCAALVIAGPGSNAVWTIDNTSLPPLDAGLYVLKTCNLGPDPADVTIFSSATLAVVPLPVVTLTAPRPAAILDDAVSCSSLDVTNFDRVDSVEVGVRIEHLRVSDLALTLVSPGGTRVLLQENRGGASTEGIGFDQTITNMASVRYSGGPQPYTNFLDTGQTSGVIHVDYNFYNDYPDEMIIYYEDTLLFDSGMTTGAGVTNLSYGPGLSNIITIVMNPNGNPFTDTAWQYTVSSTHLAPFYLTFTENTNLASFPIKFAAPPFTNINYQAPGGSPQSGIFFLPEQSLERFQGEPASGQWKLEIADTRAGATSPPPVLVSWQLAFTLRNSVPVPVTLNPGLAYTNALGPGQVQCFALDAPDWISYATNALLFATAPVNLLFNASVPPCGTNATDAILLSGSIGGSAVLGTNGSPALLPGTRYFLGVQNTNGSTVIFAVQTDFDVNSVVTLQSGFPYAAANAGPGSSDYYRFVVSNNVARAQLEINGPTGDLTLLARKGPPLPGLTRFDYLSANPGTNDELIIIFDYSSPVPLTAGEWFLSVANVSDSPASYSILATEFPVYGTNLLLSDPVLTNDDACLTWTSLPGAHYFIQAKTSLDDNQEWATVSPTITASDVFATYCLPVVWQFRFFRVSEGLALVQPPIPITSISVSAQAVELQWSAPPGQRFIVQWADSLSPPVWSSFTNLIISGVAPSHLTDDGSQSGALPQTRFYRLLTLP